MIGPEMSRQSSSVARAWVLLAVALAIHVADEAVNGFLPVYNATVIALRNRGFPLPTFTFGLWLAGLSAGVAAMLAVTPRISAGSAIFRRIAWVLGILMCMNALGHAAATIFGRTVDSVRFPRPMPGFYSSPLLLAAAIFLLRQLHRERRLRGTATGGPSKIY